MTAAATSRARRLARLARAEPTEEQPTAAPSPIAALPQDAPPAGGCPRLCTPACTLPQLTFWRPSQLSLVDTSLSPPKNARWGAGVVLLNTAAS